MSPPSCFWTKPASPPICFGGTAGHQEDLAGKAESDRTYISNLERGRRNPSLLHLKRLAKALGVRPSEFFDAVGVQTIVDHVRPIGTSRAGSWRRRRFSASIWFHGLANRGWIPSRPKLSSV